MHWNDEQKGHTENVHLIIRRRKNKKISLVYMDFDLEMFEKKEEDSPSVVESHFYSKFIVSYAILYHINNTTT